MVKSIALFTFLLLAGCSSTPLIESVKIPIASQCPVPPIVDRPSLPIEGLQRPAEPGTVAKAYKISIKMLQKWGLTLEEYLNGYRHEEE